MRTHTMRRPCVQYDEFINETYAHALRSGCAVTPLRALTAAAGGDGGAAASAMVAAVEAAVVAGSRGGAGAVGGEAVTPSSALAGDDGEAAASAAPPKQWLTDLEVSEAVSSPAPPATSFS